MRYTKSEDIVADSLTKALRMELFRRFREIIGVVDVRIYLEVRDTALP